LILSADKTSSFFLPKMHVVEKIEIITAIITHTLKLWISLLIRLWSLQNEQFMCS